MYMVWGVLPEFLEDVIWQGKLGIDRENYPWLIEETPLQVYENVLPESQFYELDKNFYESDWPKFG